MEFRACTPSEPFSIKLFHLALSATLLLVLINTNNKAADKASSTIYPVHTVWKEIYMYSAKRNSSELVDPYRRIILDFFYFVTLNKHQYVLIS